MIDNDDDTQITRTEVEMFGTNDRLIRITARSGYGWIEIRVRANGQREVWDCSRFFDDHADALSWASKVDPTLTG